uniref:Uncharacterized protein n=1 Tax=Spermophilus dauricus TaxID=99837 RepID=A0A8C9P1C4_SPEDA
VPIAPATWEAEVAGSFESRSSRSAWTTSQARNQTEKNNGEIWVWWHMPIIPEAWEATAGGA